VRDYWQSLSTKLAAASPFRCYLVSHGSKRGILLAALRTMVTNGVSPMLWVRSVTTVTRPDTSVSGNY
jgi:hypothetical protein